MDVLMIDTATPAADTRPLMQDAYLSVLSYAHGFTSWHYYQDGALLDVTAPGFFEPAADLVASGDMITISALDGVAQIGIRKVERRIVTAVMNVGVFSKDNAGAAPIYAMCWTRRRVWLVGPFDNKSSVSAWAAIGSIRNPNDDPRWHVIEPDDATMSALPIYPPDDKSGFLLGARWENE